MQSVDIRAAPVCVDSFLGNALNVLEPKLLSQPDLVRNEGFDVPEFSDSDSELKSKETSKQRVVPIRNVS